MKTKLSAIFLMLSLMAVLPFTIAKCEINTETLNSISTKDTTDKQISDSSEDKILCGLVAAKYKEEYTSETIKAIVILLNNNYKISQDNFDLTDKNDYLPVENADSSIKEVYPQIENIVYSSKELSIYFDENKKYFIPYSEISNGNTIYNDEYRYISPVASPWDYFSENYEKTSVCTGISLNGLNHLCKNGMSAENALRWYLPKCEIR